MNRPIGARLFRDDRPLELEFGGQLARLEVAYETWGRLSHRRDNAILIVPAFSGHSHAASHDGDPSPGWWEGMIGPRLAFDTDRYFVICPSALGASFGSTGPQSHRPSEEESSPRAYGSSFPVISIRDSVEAYVRLLDHLRIDRLACAAGGSMGGMATLELGIRHPGRVAKVLSASATDRTRPYTAAIRHLGRRAILLDPGYGTPEGPSSGLALAREIGTLFYRSRDEFNQRFRWQPLRKPELGKVTFDVQSYLRHQGTKILGSYDAAAYLILSMAMDLHDVWRDFPSREAALEPVEAEFLIAGVDEDRLIPIDEQEWLHHALLSAGIRSSWRPISSHIGHDTFLVDLDQMTGLVHELLG
ncbi:MAG: homoserine O-acetyltransferase [Acidobacteriota bacterium]